MSKLEDKQLAKEILVEIISKNLLSRKEYPEAKTNTDMVCSAYKTILNTISETKTEA